MENISFPIPEIKFDEDFTIIYKGKDENDSNKEKIIEIKTSREELIRRLRYFKKKGDEIRIIDEYYIHDDFNTAIFNDFISSLKTKKITINEQNYLDYSKLSSKYEYTEIQEIVDQFIKSRQDLQIIIEKLTQNINPNENEIEKEKIIAKNLDFCLEHGNLSNLPLSILIRIFNSPERNLKNHHLLFNFIKEKVHQVHKPNQLNKTDKPEDIEILISSLDLNEMSKEEIEEFLNFEGIGDTFNPKNSRQMMKNVFDSNKELEKRIDKLEAAFLDEKKKRDDERNEFLETKNKIKEIEAAFLDEKKKRDEERSEFLESKNKIKDIEAAFLSEKKKRDDERSEFLESKNKIKELEGKLEEQNQILNKFQEEIFKLKQKLVTSIEINSETKSSNPDIIIELSAIVQPKDADNNAVKWIIAEAVPKTVEILSQNEKKLTLKILKFGEKVTIKAEAVDGSGVSSSKEIKIEQLVGKITASVDQDQIIRGTINITEKSTKLYTSKSKYILNESDSNLLGENGYCFGYPIESLSQSFAFNKPQGTFYLHALIVDNYNSSYELVSHSLTVNSTKPLKFDYTGGSKSIELEAGRYKLEVWGAQGGEAYYESSRSGGKGGYSVGTIEFRSKTKVFVYVGGQGKGQQSGEKVEGGFNGGGYNADTRSDYIKGVGGGGTDIRINSDSLYSRVIVAGGGGGGNGASSGGPSNGGVGGGTNGGIGSQHEFSISDASPGTQTSGGKPGDKNICSECALIPSGVLAGTGVFGLGGSITNETYNTMAGAGGGGWYGGGAGNGHGGSGSGGSGWVFNESNYDAWKSGNSSDATKFILDKSFYLSDAKTIPGNQKFPNPAGTGQEEGHSGNGYAKITPI